MRVGFAGRTTPDPSLSHSHFQFFAGLSLAVLVGVIDDPVGPAACSPDCTLGSRVSATSPSSSSILRTPAVSAEETFWADSP